MEGSWIHFSNLPTNVLHEELVALCSLHPAIEVNEVKIRSTTAPAKNLDGADVMSDSSSGSSDSRKGKGKKGKRCAKKKKPNRRTIAFVQVGCDLDAHCLCLALNGMQFKGNTLYVRIQRKRKSASRKGERGARALILPPSPSELMDYVKAKAIQSFQRNPEYPRTYRALIKSLECVCSASVTVPPREVVLLLRQAATDWKRASDEEVQQEDDKKESFVLNYEITAEEFTEKVEHRVLHWIQRQAKNKKGATGFTDVFSSPPGRVAKMIKPVCVWPFRVPPERLFKVMKGTFFKCKSTDNDELVEYLPALKAESVQVVKRPFTTMTSKQAADLEAKKAELAARKERHERRKRERAEGGGCHKKRHGKKKRGPCNKKKEQPKQEKEAKEEEEDDMDGMDLFGGSDSDSESDSASGSDSDFDSDSDSE